MAKEEITRPHIVAGFRSVQRIVCEDFRDSICKAFPEVERASLRVNVSSSNPKFGDYQCNNAMSLFKELGAKYADCKAPKDFGERICSNLDMQHYERAAVAPAGYVTVTLKDSWLCEVAQTGLLTSSGVKCQIEHALKVGIDFSAPNIAKEMHVGHLRSTIHGESLSRVMSFVGHTVDKINHIGDWGTQFGMLIEYMSEVYPGIEKLQDGSDAATVAPNLGDLNEFYRQAKKRFDQDEDFKTRARRRVVSLQSGDAAARAAWNLLVKISMQEFEKVYQRLGIKGLEIRGESSYNEMLPDVVKRCEAAGAVTVVEGGAKCIFETPPESRSENEVPLMLVKSDGGYGYDSTDVACIFYRLIECNYQWVIYVTDKGQEDHFMKVFRFAERMGWHTPPHTRVDHCGLGLVCGDDGKKFKTRSGETVKLAALLDEAVRRAGEDLRERHSVPANEPLSPHLQQCAENIGYAAVKYFDLSQQRSGDYKFSYERMLDSKANTAVYLLYTYARICGIARKCEDPKDLEVGKLEVTNAHERELVRHIIRLPDVLETVLMDLSMHRICEYAFSLCSIFCEFYQHVPILKADNKQQKLTMCEATKRALELCFHFLGITPCEAV